MIESEANNSTVDFINVCTQLSTKEKHIKGVRSVPFDTLHTRVTELKIKTVYIHCRSGNRGRQSH